MEAKHPLEGLKGMTNHGGVTVTKMIGPVYRVFGIYCETPEDVDLLLYQAGKYLEGSIEKGKSITVKAGNGENMAINSLDASNLADNLKNIQ